jgi:hypothetical protein
MMSSESSYDRTYCAVADLGMDPSGTEAVDDALTAAIGDGVRIEFPPGDFRLERPHTLADVERHAWVGTGSDRDAVRLVLAEGALPTPVSVTDGRSLQFEGFTFVTERSRPVACAFDVRGALTVADVGVLARSDDPTPDPPALSERGCTGSETRTRTLSIAGRGAVASYEVTVSGDIEPHPSGHTHPRAANVSGPTAEGSLRDETDQYRFTGDVTAFALQGPVDVHLDGRPVSPTRLPATDGSVVRVESRRGAPVSYRLDADAPVGRVGGGAVAAEHAIDGRTATADGWVTGGRFDRFEITEGSARLFHENVLVSPAALDAPPGALLVCGDVEYTLATEGRLHEDADPTLGAGTPAEAVSGEPERTTHHRFDGAVTAFTLEGDGAATLSLR